MTTEQDFRDLINDALDDHNNRLIFADWLDEHDDPRGPGYRAMARCHLYALLYLDDEDDPEWTWFDRDSQGHLNANYVPRDWFRALDGGRVLKTRTALYSPR